MLPEPVDNHSRGKRAGAVLRVRDPVGQRTAAAGILRAGRRVPSPAVLGIRRAHEHLQEPGRGHAVLLVGVAALQKVRLVEKSLRPACALPAACNLPRRRAPWSGRSASWRAWSVELRAAAFRHVSSCRFHQSKTRARSASASMVAVAQAMDERRSARKAPPRFERWLRGGRDCEPRAADVVLRVHAEVQPDLERRAVGEIERLGEGEHCGVILAELRVHGPAGRRILVEHRGGGEMGLVLLEVGDSAAPVQFPGARSPPASTTVTSDPAQREVAVVGAARARLSSATDPRALRAADR